MPVGIRDLEELTTLFDDLDPNGKTHGIKSGISITLGKPGQPRYNVVTIASIDEAAKSLVIMDTRRDGNRTETVSFSDFYRVCRISSAVRMAGITSPTSLLSALAGSTSREYFEEISIDNDGDSYKFVPRNKR